jgi:hypothetical protein
MVDRSPGHYRQRTLPLEFAERVGQRVCVVPGIVIGKGNDISGCKC